MKEINQRRTNYVKQIYTMVKDMIIHVIFIRLHNGVITDMKDVINADIDVDINGNRFLYFALKYLSSTRNKTNNNNNTNKFFDELPFALMH